MVAREDIDALLIGALYGELTPADEARLMAHLESHPGDRSALDGLKDARRAVRESRILEVQLEPPQQISALLLQEAHRRAPRPPAEEGWFARFVRSFMAHPAMAAAAMLVVVVGVASTLYVRSGKDFESQNAEQTAATQPVVTPAAVDDRAVATSDAAAVETPTTPSEGSGMTADLAREDGDVAEANRRAKHAETKLEVAKTAKPAADMPKQVAATPTPPRKAPPAAPAPKKSRGLQIANPEPMPKELDDGFAKDVAKDKKSADRTIGAGAPGGGAATTNAVTGAAPMDYKYAAPPQAAPAAQPQAPQPNPPPPPQVQTAPTNNKGGELQQGQAKADSNDWAVSKHQLARQYAASGKCVEASRVMIEVQNRAPDYFASNMATDRALKQCKSYYDNARAQEAEKSQKSRAQKRVNADEKPAPAPDSMK